VSTCSGTFATDATGLASSPRGTARLCLEQYLELLLGPKDGGSAFPSDEARLSSWQAHAEEIMQLVEPGSRPWAWWEYERTESILPWESELAYLFRCNLLTAAERARFAEEKIQCASDATRNP
jgi:hypothetical protein